MLNKSEEYHFIFNNIIELCSGKNITVSNLIGRFASSKSAMAAWKKGNISPDVLVKIAGFFGVSLDYLMTGREAELPRTANEREVIYIFRTLDEREQLQFIGRMKEKYGFEPIVESAGVKVARTSDGVPVRTGVTSDELRIIENLPEETDF